MVSCFQELCESLDKSQTPETVLVVSHSFALIALMRKLGAPNDGFQLTNWNPEEDFKMMKNASYMKILVGKRDPAPTGPRKLHFQLKHAAEHLRDPNQTAAAPKGAFLKYTEVTAEAKEFSSCVQQ
jgi:hypothetical protein